MRILDVVTDDPNGTSTAQVCKKLGVTPQELGDDFERLRARGALLGFAGVWLTPKGLEDLTTKLTETLNKRSMTVPAAMNASGLTWKGKPLDRLLTLLAEKRKIVLVGEKIRPWGGASDYTPKQQKLLDRVLAILSEQEIEVPPPSYIARELVVPKEAVVEILRLAAQSGDVIQVDEAIYYTKAQMEAIRRLTRGHKAAAAVRDSLNTTRRYSEPILIYLRDN